MKLQPWGESDSKAPISAVLLLSLFSVGPAQTLAQSHTSPKSPKEVLEGYRKMDAEGERLTASGWTRASVFFVKPALRPHQTFVAVIDGERVTDPIMFKGDNRVEALVSSIALGQIDSSGRFTSVVAPYLLDPTGRPLKQPPTPPLMHGPVPFMRPYALVLTDTHWEFGPNGEGPREVKGPVEWRIEKFEFEPVVNIDPAIRYLIKLRAQSSSDLIKKNADKSIATLRRIKGKPLVQTTK